MLLFVCISPTDWLWKQDCFSHPWSSVSSTQCALNGHLLSCAIGLVCHKAPDLPVNLPVCQLSVSYPYLPFWKQDIRDTTLCSGPQRALQQNFAITMRLPPAAGGRSWASRPWEDFLPEDKRASNAFASRVTSQAIRPFLFCFVGYRYSYVCLFTIIVISLLKIEILKLFPFSVSEKRFLYYKHDIELRMNPRHDFL